MSSVRNYSIDLLKIVSMYMIVILHVLGQGGILYNLESLSLKYYLMWLLEIFCYVSVNCYAIITGYLMVDSKFRYKKIISLWIDVAFWSVFLSLVVNCFFSVMITQKDIILSIFPVAFNKYWYFTAYFCLFFFIPFINKLIYCMDKVMFKRFIFTIFILFSFINLVKDPFKLNQGYSFLWLVSCYFIGAYIKKYSLFEKVGTIYLFLINILCVFITFLFKMLILKFPFLTFEIFNENLFLSYNSFTILVASICLFVIFLRIKIYNLYLKRFIKRMVSATFGVYIIHVHPYVWDLFMKNRFQFIIYYAPLKMIIFVLGFAFILYMLCSYLEIIRIYLFKKLKIYKISDIIYVILKKIIKKLEW